VFLRSDDEIDREISEEILGRPYVAGNVEVAVQVDGGVVRLEGYARTRHDLDTLIELVQGVDGVVAVDSRVACLAGGASVVPLPHR
jgi:osmotically-inducible protein OsmY